MIRYIIPLLSVWLLSSCSTPRTVCSPPVVLTNNDSIATKTVTITKVDTVTVYVSVPAQVAERETFAGMSHLETDFATSDAWLNSDGSLGHRLENKPQSLATDVYVPNTTTETSEASVSIREVPVEVLVEVEVPRAFTRWESFRLSSFWYLVMIIMAGALWTFRRPLISVIKCLCK